MLVVKYYGNLIIDEGVTLTATCVDNLTYKKGMYICVLGDIKNKGTITMTARGTYNQQGENVYLWKNTNNTYEYVPSVGGEGGNSVSFSWSRTSSSDVSYNGVSGSSGTIDRATGGGGSGALHVRRADYSSGTRYSGAGSAGTSYSGGTGGGGINTNSGGTQRAGDGAANGGAGGNSYVYRGQTRWATRHAGGGAGNTGGIGYITKSGSKVGTADTSYYGNNGTGGLLIIYANDLYNGGLITSNGSNGGTGTSGGGSSGGGSINVFANNISNYGDSSASGGSIIARAGAGGDGDVTLTEVKPDLNYPEKYIKLNVGTTYKLDKNNLTYINQNDLQTGILSIGDIEFSTLDNSIATVDNTGKINAISEGITKVKIKDTTNNIDIYVFVEVIRNTKVDIQEGKNFTVALKQNGTVWSYGLNDKGQLGIGNNDNQLKPTQITSLSEIEQISTGYSHTLALTKSGEVYSWGAGEQGQLGNGYDEDSNIPIKIEELKNIVKVDAYKNMSIALGQDGTVYVWGESYSSIPMKKIFLEHIIDISGNLLLSDKGQVYTLSDEILRIEGLSDVVKISCGGTHNLALTSHGLVFAWGANTYGECGVNKTGNIENKAIMYDILEISAGNNISILRGENGEIYTFGNNENGQIGLGDVSEQSSITKLEIDKSIEAISAGEGTHSGLIAKDGFVLNTGTNTNGELGTEDNVNKNTYSQIGKTVVTTNFEQKFLDINETVTIIPRLENTFNLKVDLIDDNPNNFEVTLSETEKLKLNDKTVTGIDYCTGIANVKHKQTEVSKDVKIIVAMKMESIVQGFRDINLEDGDYSVVVNDQLYNVELINYEEDMVYSESEELGDDSEEYKTLVVKYHGDLTINEGVTLTAKSVGNLTYKKGMYLCVLGNIYNNGIITMSQKGTYNQEGENVYLWKNIDNSYEFVPAEGGEGGSSIQFSWKSKSSKDYSSAGKSGEQGENRATGGGGSGGMQARLYNYSSGNRTSGSGARGTSYSGGSGGGGINTNFNGTYAAGNASENGGAGGNAYVYRGQTSWASRYAGGGAGNIGGTGYITNKGTKYGTANTNYNGQNGTGGLLIIHADTLYNTGTISSNGSNGGTAGVGGGSSGGGSINIFARIVSENGTQDANGGIAVGSIKGGPGGNGSVTVNELGSVLNYSQKNIKLNVEQTYTIDKSKLTYTKLNEIQTEDLVMGDITYEVLDDSIISVDKNGVITGLKVGKSKVKITDNKNKYYTYIVVTVTKEGQSIPQIKEGIDYTIALKANGTVWSYGNNTNGQLGNNSTQNSNTPIQVLTENSEKMQDIAEIGVGDSNCIAVNRSGEVYTWGLYTYINEEGKKATENRIVAVKEGLTKIKKVDAYKNNFYAIDEEGKVYIWGEGYSEPTIIDTDNVIVDISGDLLLAEDGRVYTINNPNVPIKFLNNICEISAGEDHYLFVTLEGNVYSLGKGNLGALGNGTYIEKTVPTLVKTSEGFLNNVSSISAGVQTSMAVTYDGKVYVWGDNTNKKLGIEDANTAIATEINTIQDKDGNPLNIEEMEIVETGKNHSSISDKNGFVYSIGLNKTGALGTEDNQNRTIFTRIGIIDIITKPENINIPVGKTEDFIITLSNSFNLKNDVAINADLDINNTNIKGISIEKINELNNDDVADLDYFKPNYRITGKKIGRVNVVVKSNEGHEKNIWVNVVDSENAKVSAKVVNGYNFTIALRSDGTVWSFGTNEKGQLGLSDTSNRNKPVQVKTQENIIDISSGKYHTLLLGESGTVYSFGLNNNGQLGTKNTTTYKAPVKTTVTGIVKVVAHENTSFAITKEGKVYAWGAGYSKTPSLLGLDENVIDIDGDYYLADDGIVRTIKDKKEIQLSLNEYSEEPIIENEKIVQISAGVDHILMLSESGRVYSYGKNTYWQLGDATTNSREGYISTVVRTNETGKLEKVMEVSAGDRYSIVVTEDGIVYTFGINGTYQLGYDNIVSEEGDIESQYAIIKRDISKIQRVSAGYTHTTAFDIEGNIYAWGQGTEGQLGNAENANYYEAKIVGKNIIESNTNELLLQEDESFTLESKISYFNLFEDKQSNLSYRALDPSIALVRQTGEILAIKEGRTTILIEDQSTGKIGVVRLRVLASNTKPDGVDVLVEPQVKTGGLHTVTLKVDGTVWSYGQNTYGQLGDESTTNSDIPVQATFPSGTVITKIAVGEYHTLALDSQGNVWAWGRNDFYQLGSTKPANYVSKPTKVANLPKIIDIECGSYNSFAITEENEVYSWGLNADGECGIGSYTNRTTVNKVKYITDAIDIRAGKNHTIVLRSTGEVYVTGSNMYGELAKNSGQIRKQEIFTKVENLKNIVEIGSGASNGIAVNTSGNVYTWGSNVYGELGLNSNDILRYGVSKVDKIGDIRYVDGGKNTSVLVNGAGEVYVSGLNKLGGLGNNSTNNIQTFQKLDQSLINNVIDISSGDNYTVFLKTDGTVWGTGDYNQGDDTIKSQTKGMVPKQVGNKETGFNNTEILLHIGEEKDVSSEVGYQFNLIKLDKNFTDDLNYESLKDEIATVTDEGTITGIKTGTTWVKASNETNTYIIKVNVVEEKYSVSPKVKSANDFAVVLKANGNIWTFGYNSNGELADGTNITKDIPIQTNIIATYKDIAVGDNFIVALRNNNTVWTSGSNTYGQLGIGNTEPTNKLSQVNGIFDIVKIAAGKNHTVALDKYGTVYGFGKNDNGQLGKNNIGEVTNTPVPVIDLNEKVVNISAGSDETVLITSNGKVYGMGNILDGYLSGINNAVKAEVGNGYILILTNDNKIYKFKENTLTQIDNVENAIDISVMNNVNMYQSIDEETYTWGENTYGQLGNGLNNNLEIPTLVKEHGTNTYTIGAGYNNTYIIENTGSVYASGYNEYGALGNSLRKDSNTHMLVGNRKFEILPEKKIMLVNDKEKVTIKSDTFNVFKNGTKTAEEYTWESDNEGIVSAKDGELTAHSTGTAIITVTDKITGENVKIERYVQDIDKHRIDKITVDSVEATPAGYKEDEEEVMTYEVKIETSDDKGLLVVKTKDTSDLISLDEDEWTTDVGHGSLAKEVELKEKITEIPVYIKITNGTTLKYIVKVEKISTDVGIKEIKLTVGDDVLDESTTINATPVSLTRYEAILPEDQDVTLADVIANSEYAYVSIDGKEYTQKEQTKNIALASSQSKEVKIIIKSESGIEQEYTLVIYKESESAQLEIVTVNNIKATKVSEGKYSVTVDSDVSIGTVYVKAKTNLAQVSIENNKFSASENTQSVQINNNPQEVSIHLKLPNDEIVEYTLEIHQKTENLLDMVIVNSTVITPNKEGIYEAYVPSAETSAIIRAIAKEVTSEVQIETNTPGKGESEAKVEVSNDKNTYKIKVTPEEGETKEYTVVIKKAESDTSLKSLYVQKQEFTKYAEKVNETTYEVKVPRTYTDFDVTAITGYVNAQVSIGEIDVYTKNRSTKNIELSTESDTTEVTIKVKSENGENVTEYTLRIVKMSNETGLQSVRVNDIDATYDKETGEYTVYLQEAVTECNVEAVTVSESAHVKINTEDYEEHETTRNVTIDSKRTKATITVKAEDGTIKSYVLNIQGLPDDITIKQVLVNDIEATYIEGEYRYEIRDSSDSYKIDVTLNDELATLVLGDNPSATGFDTINVSKEEGQTIVQVTVTSQNKLETQTYTIVIMEKSNNTELDTIKVNDEIIEPDLDGVYRVGVKNSVTQINVEAIAEDTMSITQINDKENNSYIATLEETIVNDKVVYKYKIVVTAENGSSKEYELEVTHLEANLEITSVQVGKDIESFEKATYNEEDGKYYYKIDNVDNAYVKVELDSEKSNLTIDESSDNPKLVKLEGEKTTVKILVTAEDGTIKTVELIIQKKSTDVSIKEVKGEGILSKEINDEVIDIFVNEDLTETDLEVILNCEYASIKLQEDDDTEYKKHKMSIKIDLTEITSSDGKTIYVDVLAEDGITHKEYIINIYKEPDLSLLSVTVNDIEVQYDEIEEIYEALVAHGNKPNIVIKTNNDKQTIQLFTSDEKSLGSAKGTLTISSVNLSTTELLDEFKIVITSHNGEAYGNQEYVLNIRQKSTETGIVYIKVDGYGTSLVDNTYSAAVAGKDSYPVEIKLKDDKAKVRVTNLDDTVVISEQTGLLKGNITLKDGETKQFKVIVTSENGDEETYYLDIERVSSNTDIESITVTDLNPEYDSDSETDEDPSTQEKTIKKLVVVYDEQAKTYRVQIDNSLNETEITIKAKSSLTQITVEGITSEGEINVTKELGNESCTRIPIELIAADRTKETRYLEIIRLTSEIQIQELKVDDNIVEPDESGNYEYTVSDEKDLANVNVILKDNKSMVSINSNEAKVAENTADIAKGNNRKLVIPIVVTSESGVSHTYYLTLNIISHDTSVRQVLVEDKEAKYIEEEYIAYFDREAQSVKIKVQAGVPYSKVKHINDDGTESENIEYLEFTLDTSDLSLNEFETTFTIIAEDESIQEYKVKCIRNSNDCSIEQVYGNNILLEKNVEDGKYPGNYYFTVSANTAKVKVITNNEFAEVSFNGNSGIHELEQIITLSTTEKITEVPVTIKSQQGDVYTTKIYIEKLSTNNNLLKVDVNYTEATKEEDKFVGYIYDTADSAYVQIQAESEDAIIYRTDEYGNKYVSLEGEPSEGKHELSFDVKTPTDSTIVYFKIVSESGTESMVYILEINKMSTDATLSEVYVNGNLIPPDEDGNYHTTLLDTFAEPEIRAITTHALAHVRIGLGTEQLHEATETEQLTVAKQTVIPILVRSQSGFTKRVYLYIDKISTSVNLSSVTLDDREADFYDENTHTYRFLVDNSTEEYELAVIAENSYTTLEYDGETYEDGSFIDLIKLPLSSDGTTLTVLAKAESGNEVTYTIKIIRTSDDTDLEYLKVNDIEREPDEQGKETYTVMIPKKATQATIEVQTVFDYATVRIGDNITVDQHDKVAIQCDLDKDRLDIPILVTAGNGIDTRTYHVILVRGLDNTEIELQVNNNVIDKDEDGNYFTKVPENAERIIVKATALEKGVFGGYAKIDLNATGEYKSPTKEIELNMDELREKGMIQILVQVISEDGTERDSILTITLQKGTYIVGKILTENVHNRHISNITVYKTSDTRKIGDAKNPRKEIAKVQTNEDGTFRALIYMTDPNNLTDKDNNGIADELDEKYDVVVTKAGYLSYTVTNIEIEEEQETSIGEENLIAGDVIETGEIEIDDLVAINNNFEVDITEDNEICDLNEDSVIDLTDRNILVGNYGKLAEVVKWVNPNAPEPEPELEVEQESKVEAGAESQKNLQRKAYAETNINTQAITNKQSTVTNYTETTNQVQTQENKLILPLSCNYKITSNYGYRTSSITGKGEKHCGIDLCGDWHTEIHSIADGEVTWAGVKNSYGNCVEIKHVVNGETIYSFYAHLSRIDVQAGQKVKQGDVIALEGGQPNVDPNTGDTTGHHLHFEIRKKSGYGNDMDPNLYFKF